MPTDSSNWRRSAAVGIRALITSSSPTGSTSCGNFKPYHGWTTTNTVKQAFVRQHSQSVGDGVRTHTESTSQHRPGRQRLATGKCPGCDVFAEIVSDLLIQRTVSCSINHA
jgi:hypothetical protein